MDLKNSHGGNQGLSIADKIERRLDQVFAENQHHIGGNCSPADCPASNYRNGQIDAHCFDLALMRQSSKLTELDDARARFAADEGVLG
jgi:hypothetical protein